MRLSRGKSKIKRIAVELWRVLREPNSARNFFLNNEKSPTVVNTDARSLCGLPVLVDHEKTRKL